MSPRERACWWRGYSTAIISVGLVYAGITLLGGCAPGVPTFADGECTAEFALAGSTDADGLYDATVPCYDDRPDGTRDMTDCCPEGWTALGLAPDGNGVVCAP